MSNIWQKQINALNKGSSSTTKKKNKWQQMIDDLEAEEIAPTMSETTKKAIAAASNASFNGVMPGSAKVTTLSNEKTTEKKKKWFDLGAFKDGYQFGDLTKTAVSSAKDIATNMERGAAKMLENAIDAPATGIAWGLDKAGMKDASKSVQNFIAKDLTQGFYDVEVSDIIGEDFAKKIGAQDTKAHDAITKLAPSVLPGDPISILRKSLISADRLINGTEDNSVLGEKAESLAQSGGQFAGQMALNSLGIPWYVTAGVTSFAGESEQALQQGATIDQAAGSGLISAGVEIISEKLFGGSGLGEAGLIPIEDLTKNITNKALKRFLDFGIDITSEGFEEVFSEFMGNLGSAIYRTKEREGYDAETMYDILLSDEALEGYLDSAIGGMVISGVANAPKVRNSAKTGRDYRTGLTDAEAKVVEAEYEARLEEAQKKGEVGKKDQAKIRAEVIEDLEKGRISTDTIEKVLGGDTYKAYTEALDGENALQQEFETLGGKENPTLADQTRYNELLEQMNANKDITPKSKELHDQLRQEVFEMTKDKSGEYGYLAESYRENARRKEAYSADLSKYKPKEAEFVRKAIDSGVLNNTNRTHEFVDMLAKIHADKGVDFNFTDNAKLKESGFAVDGKTVNGYVTKDGITLNIDSHKALNKVVGHEVAHVLEGTEMYTALQSVVTEYARTKGEYDSRRADIAKLYEGVDNADIDAELTADLVGDYLFTDPEFVKTLSIKHRNVFQKIYDEIKYLCKIAAAGSEEARKLEEIKKRFAEAYRAEGKGLTDTKYALSYTKDNRPVAVIEGDIFKGKFEELTDSERLKIVKDAIKEFRPGIPVSGRLIGVSRKSAGHFTNSDYTDMLRNNDQVLYEDKLNIAQNVDDVVYATTDYINEDLKHPRKDNIKEFARGTVLLDVGGNKYEANVIVGFTDMRDMILYDVQDLKPTEFEIKEKKTQPKLAGNEADTRKTVVSSTENTIPQMEEIVKMSLSDSDGNQLSVEKQERLVDSKVRDENGSIKVMYHGTPNGDYTGFKPGTYFTDNKAYADRYQNTGASSISSGKTATNPKTFAVYLNIKKPFDINDAEARNIYINDYIKGGNALGINPYMSDAEYDKITTIDWTEAEDLRDFLVENGYDYDGLVVDEGADGGYGEDVVSRGNSYMIFNSDQVVPIDDASTQLSLSEEGEQIAPVRSTDTYGKDIKLEKAPVQEDFAPAREVVAENATTTSSEDVAPIPDDYDEVLRKRMEDMINGNYEHPVERYNNPKFSKPASKTTDAELFPDDAYAPIADDPTRFDSLDDADAPPERVDESGVHASPTTMPKNAVTMIAQNVKANLWVTDAQMGEVRSIIEDYASQEFPNQNKLFRDLKDKFGTHIEKVVDEGVKEVKNTIRKYRLNVSDTIKGDIADYNDVRRRNFGKVLFSRQGTPVDIAYEELSNMYPGYFPPDITNPTDQLWRIIDVANQSAESVLTHNIEDEYVWDVVNDIAEAVSDYQHIQSEKASTKKPEGYMEDLLANGDDYAPIRPPVETPPDLTAEEREYAPTYEALEREGVVGGQQTIYAPPTGSGVPEYDGDIAPTYDAQPGKGVADGQQTFIEEEPITEEARKETRKQLHQRIIDGIKNAFKGNGFDLDKVLKNAKNLPTFSTVDNTPQRVMEKALGYKEGGILADLTVNKVAQNETEGIKWLNSYTDRKNGILKQISKQYHIKPGSKESAAAQMYAEGFYVAKNGDIIAYGAAELAKDFPDIRTQQNIKDLAKDPRIRQIYDDTLSMINESRERNGYDPIQKLDNYYLHFRAMEDTFSKIGLPFNPNDIRAKDLPTDLNGVTADLKPGQPYFASAMHRTGKRTSFDLLGGLERYLTSAKNQIYHIDDIQTLRALRNYIADTYGQANGLEGLDVLSEEEAQQRIEQVYNSHLSTFAKFLNEEANILAGKTSLIDRGLEGIIGRRGITFLGDVTKQTSRNMVGYNISSSLTNFLPVAQTVAKTNKFDFTKAFAQTVGNRISSLFGRTDGFADNSPVMIRRKGADQFYRTAWQKLVDPGYVFMGAVDSISTELIARTKYNELTRKGMDAQKAHYETDKWVSKLMGDRSLGQMPQLYNSKTLGIFTQFQLEVRNQLDSQFYDTIQEAKASNEDIENGLARNAKTAAKVASTFLQLAVVQHLFGKAFESVAGYNPAFDIIEVLMTAFGFDDEEDSEDTALDNIEQGFLALLEDLPYTSTFTGGRIPMSSVLPVEELVTGKDEFGKEKSRWETVGEIAPYLLPGGYGQIKKSIGGLSMFSDDHPIAGSYTDKGDLRFPVEDTLGNRIKAGIFGQWANDNARSYFDNERKPLDEKRTKEFTSLGLSYDDYWEYRDDMSEIAKRAKKEGASDEDILKSKYIDSVDSALSAILSEKEEVASDVRFSEEWRSGKMKELDEQYDALVSERYNSYNDVSFEDFDGNRYARVGGNVYKFNAENDEWKKLDADQVTKYEVTSAAGEDAHYATNGTVHYRRDEDGKWTKISDKDLARQKEVTRELGITPEEYWSKTETSFIPMKKGEYEYAFDNPGKYAVAKAVGGYDAYKTYTEEITAIKDSNPSDSGTKDKDLVTDYIIGLDLDYGQKIILYRSMYSSKTDRQQYDDDIFEYLEKSDMSYEEKVNVLEAIGYEVSSGGYVKWKG